MTQHFTVPERPARPDVTATFTHAADNSLLTVDGQAVSLDDDGNLLSARLAAGAAGDATMVWDTRNRLTSLTMNGATVSHTYDAEGRRITKTTSAGTTTYVHSPGAALSQLLVETLPGGARRWFVHGPGGIQYQVENDGTAYYLHGDQIGSVLAITNSSGQVVKRWGYTPYGEAVTLPPLAGTVPDATTPTIFAGAPEHGYVGQWGVMTDENGLLHMRARYYSPYLRRFLNEDPIGFEGGMNWFAYAGGDTLSNIDPSGLKDYRVIFYDGNEPGGRDGNGTFMSGADFKYVADTWVAHGKADIAINAPTQADIVRETQKYVSQGDRFSATMFLDHGGYFTDRDYRFQSYGSGQQMMLNSTVTTVINASVPNTTIGFLGCSVGAGDAGSAYLKGFAQGNPGTTFSAATTNLHIVPRPGTGTAYVAYIAPQMFKYATYDVETKTLKYREVVPAQPMRLQGGTYKGSGSSGGYSIK